MVLMYRPVSSYATYCVDSAQKQQKEKGDHGEGWLTCGPVRHDPKTILN